MDTLSKKPYSERTRLEQIESNWNKTTGLFRRSEYSTVAIRAATTVELAANLLIESELIENRNLPVPFVEGLMKWANGFMGKLDRLLIPIFQGTGVENQLKEVRKLSKDINDERNNVVHRGQFKQRATAMRLIQDAEIIVNSLVKITGSDFKLVTPSFDDEEDDA